MSPHSVLIADDDPLFRGALADLISSEPELELVASAADAHEAIELAAATQPAAAVIDVRMPGGGGARAARGIAELSPDTRIVACSAYDDRGIVLDMLRAGATSYLLKGCPADEIVSTIVHAATGEAVLSPEITGGVLDELATHVEQRDRAREKERVLNGRIRQTLEERKYRLVFQPIVELATGAVVGVEALSRFFGEPLQGPERWFADAEHAGLRIDLELATARAALTFLTNLNRSAFMSINLSPATLPRCDALLRKAGAHRLVVEITEHAAVDDYDALSPHVHRLKADGARLAVDDTGAGFASLRHVLQLAPDFLKLDISLTHGIDRDRGRRALAAALVGFAREIDSEIIAEGIETQEELETLRGIQVRYGQGYYLGGPGPLESVAA